MIPQKPLEIAVYPATPDRWPDLETVFGPKGACGQCWCMFWRLKRSDYHSMPPEARKAVLQNMTLNNEVPGLLAYVNGQPAGWISIAPRQSYTALENSRILKRLDDTPVWSVVCFFVLKPYRKQNVMFQLLHGAVEYAGAQGAQTVEGYPLDMQTPKLAGRKLSGSSGYMGIASVFREAGFVEAARASETQVIMRYNLKNQA